MKRRTGFTLIELLIVVAIIAVLASIAVPNFMSAMARSKVSRVKADMRTLRIALESYFGDFNVYPPAEINGTPKWLYFLSTPTQFLSSVNVDDPFTPDRSALSPAVQIPTLRYFGFNDKGVLNADSETGRTMSPREGQEALSVFWYTLFSHGPDGVKNNLTVTDESGTWSGTFVKNEVITDPTKFIHFVYDPTNGARSIGEIFKAGGEAAGATNEVHRFISTWLR